MPKPIKAIPASRHTLNVKNLAGFFLRSNGNIRTLIDMKKILIGRPIMNGGPIRLFLHLDYGTLAFDVWKSGKVVLNKGKSTTNAGKMSEIGPFKSYADHPVADFFRRDIEKAIKAGKK